MSKNYVATDIHGDYNLYSQMMKYLSQQEDYHLYYLGDAIDRGPDGYKIMKQLLNNPQVIYIKGNHEDMFVRAAFEFATKAYNEGESCVRYAKHFGNDTNLILDTGIDMRLYDLNGGGPTFKAWIKDRCPMNIIHKINHLPLKASYNEFDMCHAGCTIQDWENNDDQAFLWDRRHFGKKWYEGRTLIHGHTPIQSLPEDIRWSNHLSDWRAKPYQGYWSDMNKDYKYDLDAGREGLNLMRLETKEIIYF